jgi:Ca-activated chloride channel family protein
LRERARKVKITKSRYRNVSAFFIFVHRSFFGKLFFFSLGIAIFYLPLVCCFVRCFIPSVTKVVCMIRFQHSEYLFTLLLIPILSGLFWWGRRQKKRSLESFGDPFLLHSLFPEISQSKPFWKLCVFLLGYCALIIGASNPQIGTSLERVKREGVNIFIALDVSNSMKAEDVKPNRLDRSKQAISRMLDKLSNDRVGLIIFAGDAFLQLPLTNDYAAVKLMLSAIETNSVSTQGTNIGAAINLALESFNMKEKRYNTLIIITDGEDHEQSTFQAAKKARSNGIAVHTVGVGSLEGAPIPVYAMGFQTGFRKDRNGNVVITKLNEKNLREIASATGGVYVRGTNAEAGLNVVVEEINKMEKKELGTKVFANYESRFQYALSLALVLLISELLLSDFISKRWQKLNLFGHSSLMPSQSQEDA